MSDINIEIGRRIKELREQKGMSQEELAKRLGYKSRSSVNKIELGQRSLTQSKIKAIADALDTTPMFIMGWSDSQPTTYQYELTADEIAMVLLYREADQSIRDIVDFTLSRVKPKQKDLPEGKE